MKSGSGLATSEALHFLLAHTYNASMRGPANDWRGRCVYMFVHALNSNCKLSPRVMSLTKDRIQRTCTCRISWPPWNPVHQTSSRRALLTGSVKKPPLPTWNLELRTQLKSQVFVVVVSSLYCRLSTCSTSMQRNCKQLPLGAWERLSPPSAHRFAGANELMHVCARADVCVSILATRLFAPSAST